jgi:hypothetical protein
MENLLLILATSFVLRLSSSRKLQHCFIGDTGCFLLFAKSSPFEKRKTESGDDLYFNEFSEKGVTYGVICVEMKSEYDPDDAIDMLARYMNQLRGPFFVFHQVGQERSKDWNHASSITLVDYWQDARGVDCKVKGYTNGKTLAVLYVRNIGEAEVAKQEAFLDSFHFHSGQPA